MGRFSDRVLPAAALRARALRFAWRRRIGARRDVLFVSGPGGEARRYRCDHPAEALRSAGCGADVGYFDELELPALAGRYRTIVLYRVPWDERVAELLEAARGAGTHVAADVDDLVFDPDRVELMRWLEGAGVDRLEEERERARSLRRTLAAVDGVVVSTEPLARCARDVNPNVAVVHNAISSRILRAGAGAAAARTRRSRAEIIVAYLSGTATHDRDFLEAAPAVAWALERYEHVRFWAVGHLTLDDSFDRFGDRVVRIPHQPLARLPRLLANIDVNLAPLELGNEFTDAKSCLKYLEAGVVGVPTIASPTADFARVIEHGRNGFLAERSRDWREALGTLVERGERRLRMGTAARGDVVACRTAEAAAPALVSALVPGHPFG